MRFGAIVRVEPLIPSELALPFAGRETELALLAARMADAAKRRGSITLVHGEAGVGKTTLLNRCTAIAAEHGLRTLTLRDIAEDTSPLGPWRRLFFEAGAGDLDVVVRAHPSDLPTAVAHAFAAGLSEPTLLIVDDAHELAGEALDIFVALAQAASAEHAIIAGVRPEGLTLLRSRFVDASFEELPIGRLDRSAVNRNPRRRGA